MAKYCFTIEEDVGARLDVFLTHAIDALPSRSFLKKLMEQKRVTVNGEVVKLAYKLEQGDVINVVFHEEDLPDEGIYPEDKEVDVFYEDDVLAVINKPIDLTVHPMPGHTSGTLVNRLMARFDSLSDINGLLRPGIVHRLDKETSGLMVIAKNNQAHQRLVRQFQKHKIFKQYVALVRGAIAFEEGEINAPIGQNPKHHDHRIVNFDDEMAKDALTMYKVVDRRDDATLVRLFPKTGRTHQLRLHMRHLGHPILGDAKYGAKQLFNRLALHAQALGFEHPLSKKKMMFVSKMPKEFISHMNR